MMKFNNWHPLPPRPKSPHTPRRSLGTGSTSSSPGISLAITEGGLVWLVLTCWWVMTWQHCGTALFTMYSVSGTLDIRTIRRRTRSVCSTIISSSTDCNDSHQGPVRPLHTPHCHCCKHSPRDTRPHHSDFVRSQTTAGVASAFSIPFSSHDHSWVSELRAGRRIVWEGCFVYFNLSD